MLRSALAAAVLLLAAGCDSADDDPLRADLTVGSTSTYTTSFIEVLDGVETVLASSDIRVSVVGRRETVTGETRGGDTRTVSGLSRLYLEQRETSEGETRTYSNTTWYRDRDDRLEEVANANSGAVAISGLKRSDLPGFGWSLSGPMRPADGLTAGKDSSTFMRQTPRVVVDYAAADGDSWDHFEVEDGVTSQRRRVGVRMVDTVAGRFECVEIETTYSDAFEDIVWTDCVGAPGLVSREVRFGGIPSTTEGDPPVLTPTVGRWTLTSYTPAAAKR